MILYFYQVISPALMQADLIEGKKILKSEPSTVCSVLEQRSVLAVLEGLQVWQSSIPPGTYHTYDMYLGVYQPCFACAKPPPLICSVAYHMHIPTFDHGFRAI